MAGFFSVAAYGCSRLAEFFLRLLMAAAVLFPGFVKMRANICSKRRINQDGNRTQMDGSKLA